MTYAWCEASDPGTTLSTTDTLEIPNAQLANEGRYYCTVTVVDPAVNISADSRTAILVIERLAGHWPFDRSLADVIAGNDAAYTGTKDKYDTGLQNDALDLADTTSAATISITPYINKNWSLSWWDFTYDGAPAAEWESMVASGPVDGYELMEFDRVSYYDTVGLEYAGGFNITGDDWAWIGSYPRGEWNHHVLIFDIETRICSWFFNGEKAGETDGISFADFDPILYVGNCKDGTQPFNGMIDDLRFYNYTADAYLAAELYLNVVGGMMCVENPTYDFNDDCVVDLNDLAVFLQDWTKCGLYPTCIN